MLTKYFDYVYVINLAAREDRREEMAQQLRRLDLDFEAPGMVLFPAYRPDHQGDFTSIGARGCFMSHLDVLRDARRRRARSILLLEDDCDFLALGRLADALEALHLAGGDGGWDIFYGGYELWDPPGAGGDPPLVPVPFNVGLQTAHCVAFSAAAIATTVPYLEAMLRRPPGDPEGGPMHVDGAYCWLREQNPQLRTLAAHPKICRQRASRSDIASLAWYDTAPWARPLMVPYRHAKRLLRRTVLPG